jgi:periplasmic protein CpxP/Spy
VLSSTANPTQQEREEVATELRRFASDLNLTDDQKEKLHVALTDAREKIAEYMQQHPDTTRADVISKVVANRDAIRERVVSFLSPEQLKKWDAEKAKAKDFLGQKIAA